VASAVWGVGSGCCLAGIVGWNPAGWVEGGGEMDVCLLCWVLSGRGLCVGPITRPEGSCRVWLSWSLDIMEFLAHEGLLLRGERIQRFKLVCCVLYVFLTVSHCKTAKSGSLSYFLQTNVIEPRESSCWLHASIRCWQEACLVSVFVTPYTTCKHAVTY